MFAMRVFLETYSSREKNLYTLGAVKIEIDSDQKNINANVVRTIDIFLFFFFAGGTQLLRVSMCARLGVYDVVDDDGRGLCVYDDILSIVRRVNWRSNGILEIYRDT